MTSPVVYTQSHFVSLDKKYQIPCIQFNWTIKPFPSPHPCIRSPEFFAGGYLWQLMIRSCRRNINGTISDVFAFFIEASNERNLTISFSLSIVDSRGQTLHTLKKFGNWQHFASLRTLECGCLLQDEVKDKFLQNGCRLTLLCEAIAFSEQETELEAVKPVVKRNTECAQLLVDFQEMLERGEENGDFIVEAVDDGMQFKVHALILSARSKYFAAMLSNEDTQEFVDRRVEIVGVSGEVVGAMLHFLYTGKLSCELDTEAMVGLLKAADRYQLDDLKAFCECRLCDLLTVANVCGILADAETYRAVQLKAFAGAFIHQNKAELKGNEGLLRLCKSNPELAIEFFF